MFHWIRTRVINTFLVGLVLELKPENHALRRRYYLALNKISDLDRRRYHEDDNEKVRRAKRVFVAVRYLVLRANNGDIKLFREYRAKVNRLFQMKDDFENARKNGNSKTDSLMDEQDTLRAELDAIDEQLFIHANRV